MPLMLEAVPSFAATWADLRERHQDPEFEHGRLNYADAGSVASHLVELMERGETEEVAAAFAVIERLTLEGDDYVRELAVIGYLEDLQNIAGRSQRIGPTAFVAFLGTESARWWRGLNAFWSGEVPPPVRPVD